jgi:hypothetical protein
MGRSKKVEEDSDEDVLDEPVKKSNKKKEVKEEVKKEVKKEKEKEVKETKKSKKKDEEDDEDDKDEFSVDTSNIPMETKKQNYDVNKPLGNCTLTEIFDYLIELGTNNMNPQLRQGTLDLKRTLQGKVKPAQPFNTGNYRGGFNNRGRGGFQGNSQGQGQSQGGQRNPQAQQTNVYQ